MRGHCFFIIHFILSVILTSNVTLKGENNEVLVFKEDFKSIGDNGVPVGWEAWTPPNMEMLFVSCKQASFQDGTGYRMSGNGKYHSKGALRKNISGFIQGSYYKFCVYFSTDGIEQSMHTKILPVIKWGQGFNFKRIVPVELKNGCYKAELIHQIPSDSNEKIILELFAGWIPNGSVFWEKVEIFRLERYIPKQKTVHIAVLDKAPPEGSTSEENGLFYSDQIDKICKESPLDAVCLTELFNIRNVIPANDQKNAVSIDSDYMEKIKAAAKRNNVNIVGSFLENENGILFNTGILINRHGKVVDKYHKAQLAQTEMLFSDRSRGDELKVFEADFGKIGIAICWDYHYPEFIRTLALKGADIIFVPIAGDGRYFEDGISKGMEYVGKAIVLENRIPIVFAKYAGTPENPSRLINNEGQVVAKSVQRQAFISAELDLNHKKYMWNKSDYTKAYFTSRRPELYKELVNDTTLLYKKGTY